ncbi:hypothetical protein MYTO111405_00005 [Mycoplasma todarodis]
MDNIDWFKKLFENARLIHQGNRTTAKVAKSMNKGSLTDKIKAIETETGIKVPTTVNGTKITSIQITKKADGVIRVAITTETPGAPKAQITFDVEINGKKKSKVNSKVVQPAKKTPKKPKRIKAHKNASVKSKDDNKKPMKTILAVLSGLGGGIVAAVALLLAKKFKK